MAWYNNHETHGWVSLVLNLVLIAFLVIIVCCAHDIRKSSWCSKKRIMFYILLSLYALGTSISALLLFYHDHEDQHYGGDPLIQMVIWIYCGSYIETIIFYMWTIEKEYCCCVEGKYSFIVMPIFILVITGLLVGIYAATPTIGAFYACFYIFLVLTMYTIAHLFFIMYVNGSFNPYYIVHIGMGLVAFVWLLSFLLVIITQICRHCLILFIYGTNIWSISAFVLIYDKEIDQLLKKLTERQPLVAAGDVDDGNKINKLKLNKNEKQQNIKIVEDEDENNNTNNDNDDGSTLAKMPSRQTPKILDEQSIKKSQMKKPQVNIEPVKD